MRFDLTDMRLFLNVAEAASITGGAERSHLALASASARIRAMEETLGTPLLERQRRGVRLTPAGRAVVEDGRLTPAGRAVVHHARMMLQQVERMHGELRDYARGLKGHVRLLCNTSALVEFLPETLAAFLVQHPDIDIDLEERLSHQIVDAVAEGLADAGIVADTVDLGDLEVFPFRIDRLVAVVPRGHRLARRKSVAFRDTLADDFVGLSRDSALQEHLARHAARTGRAFNVRVRVGTFDAICRMVELGVGVGVIPDTAARRCRRSMKIHVVPLTDGWALRHLMICIRRFDDLPAHAKQLVTFLKLAGDDRAMRRTRPS